MAAWGDDPHAQLWPRPAPASRASATAQKLRLQVPEAPPPPPGPDDIDVELATWKKARKRSFPRRQLFFAASVICVVIALVLPQALGDVAGDIFYALAAISFFGGTGFGRKKPS